MRKQNRCQSRWFKEHKLWKCKRNLYNVWKDYINESKMKPVTSKLDTMTLTHWTPKEHVKDAFAFGTQIK